MICEPAMTKSASEKTDWPKVDARLRLFNSTFICWSFNYFIHVNNFLHFLLLWCFTLPANIFGFFRIKNKHGLFCSYKRLLVWTCFSPVHLFSGSEDFQQFLDDVRKRSLNSPARSVPCQGLSRVFRFIFHSICEIFKSQVRVWKKFYCLEWSCYSSQLFYI